VPFEASKAISRCTVPSRRLFTAIHFTAELNCPPKVQEIRANQGFFSRFDLADSDEIFRDRNYII